MALFLAVETFRHVFIWIILFLLFVLSAVLHRVFRKSEYEPELSFLFKVFYTFLVFYSGIVYPYL